jgi:Arc/MetJ family transcription regulator
MATNLALDDRLISKAAAMGGHRAKSDAVNAALREYVRRQRRLRILDLEGTVDFRKDWDHKSDRRRGLKRITLD